MSLIKPDNYDWESTRALNAEHAHLEGMTPSPQVESSSSSTTQTGKAETEAVKSASEAPTPAPMSPVLAASSSEKTAEPIRVDEERQMSLDAETEESPSSLRSAFKLACIASFILPFIMDFLIPIPMFLSHYIFSEGFFLAWIIISFLWVFGSALISVILPIWETRGFFAMLFREVSGDLRRRKRAA